MKKKLENLKENNGLIINVIFVDRTFGASIEDRRSRLRVIKTYL
jgi:hypothetical protein